MIKDKSFLGQGGGMSYTPHVVIGGRYRVLLENPLKKHGISALWMPDNINIDPRISSHADLSAFVLRGYGEGSAMHGHNLSSDLKASSEEEKLSDSFNRTAHNTRGKIIAAENLFSASEIVSYLFNYYDVLTPAKEPAGEYPGDIPLCACRIGDYVVCKAAKTDSGITTSGLTVVNVSQGYAKCSVCVVNDGAVITSDSGIYQTLQDLPIDVLKISPGFIRLDGFDYGFVGGASFALNETVYFTGRLDGHPDRDKIESFIFSHGRGVEYLTELPAFDIGGVVIV